MKKVCLFIWMCCFLSACTIDEVVEHCGNGKLDLNEDCDGELVVDGICGEGYEISYRPEQCSQKCKIDIEQYCRIKPGFENVGGGIAKCSSAITEENGVIKGELMLEKTKFAGSDPFYVCMECSASSDSSNVARIYKFGENELSGCDGAILKTDDNGHIEIQNSRLKYKTKGLYHCYIYVRGREEIQEQYDKKEDSYVSVKFHNVYYCGENNVLTTPRLVVPSIYNYIEAGDSLGLYQYEFTVE